MPMSILEIAEEHHRKAGYDFPIAFDYFFEHGYILKGPDFFIMGQERTNSQYGKHWFIWYMYSERDDLSSFLSMMPYELPYIAFARGLRDNHKERYYSTERLTKILKYNGRRRRRTKISASPGPCGSGPSAAGSTEEGGIDRQGAESLCAETSGPEAEQNPGLGSGV